MDIKVQQAREHHARSLEKEAEAGREREGLRTPEQVEGWRVKHLGQSSALAQAQKSIGKLPGPERKAFGELVSPGRSGLSVHPGLRTSREPPLPLAPPASILSPRR